MLLRPRGCSRMARSTGQSQEALPREDGVASAECDVLACVLHHAVTALVRASRRALSRPAPLGLVDLKMNVLLIKLASFDAPSCLQAVASAAWFIDLCQEKYQRNSWILIVNGRLLRVLLSTAV